MNVEGDIGNLNLWKLKKVKFVKSKKVEEKSISETKLDRYASLGWHKWKLQHLKEFNYSDPNTS